MNPSRRCIKAGDSSSVAKPENQSKPGMKMWLAVVCILGGLAALIVGGNWIVDGASGIGPERQGYQRNW